MTHELFEVVGTYPPSAAARVADGLRLLGAPVRVESVRAGSDAVYTSEAWGMVAHELHSARGPSGAKAGTSPLG